MIHIEDTLYIYLDGKTRFVRYDLDRLDTLYFPYNDILYSI